MEALEDELFALREEYGASAFPETAISYLNSGVENDRGWLRKFYPHGTDEPQFDFTPATEKAITWVSSLTERSFVGTESRLFTENETNVLSLPPVPHALVLFGAGYGFENLAKVSWLSHIPVFYWGDLDTHGFAIPNQLRTILPHCASFLMDHETLWVREPEQARAELSLLTPEEKMVYYEGLQANLWGNQVRLEQERVGFAHVCRTLEHLQESLA